jgi:flagellar biosynthesis/type III secretory pathway protein FliH
MGPAMENASTGQPGPRVVKGDDVKVRPLYPYTRLLKSNVLEAAETVGKAEHMLEEARREADRIRQEAKAEVEIVRQRAYEEGARRAQDQIADVVGAIARAGETLKADVAAQVVELVQTFAREILRAECRVGEEAMIRLVESVLEHAVPYSSITIVLHPEDAEVVKAHSEDLLERLPFAESLQFKEDPYLDRHGCRIETEMGTFDGSLAVQLANLHEHLLSGEEHGEAESPPHKGQES